VKGTEDFLLLLQQINYPGFTFALLRREHQHYLQVVCLQGTDNQTKEPCSWSGRKWRLSPHMTNSEVVQTAFLAVLTALEHEARERFTYRGQSVLDGHFDLDQLASLRANKVLLIDGRRRPADTEQQQSAEDSMP
jgi:hypothetical protein